MNFTTSKILAYIVTLSGIAYGFLNKDAQTMMLMTSQGVLLIGGKTYLQSKTDNK
jgi:hypothetical protein